MAKITDLRRESQELFLTKFAEIKGILGELGKMKILLKVYVNPVKKHPY